MLRSTLTPLAFLVLSACADEAGTLVAPDHPLVDNSSEALASLGRGSVGSDVLADLAAVRRATARFHNIESAMEAGYTVWIPDPFAPNATCPSSPEGNMGYHLVNVGLRGGAANPVAGDAVLDPLQPEMLLYEKRPSGKLHLVGVEYIVFTAAWERVNGAGAAPPVLFGQTVPHSVHTFPGNANPIPHYEIHVWLWSTNPLGMFHHWNPTVRC
jgi:hypothetical protein